MEKRRKHSYRSELIQGHSLLKAWQLLAWIRENLKLALLKPFAHISILPQVNLFLPSFLVFKGQEQCNLSHWNMHRFVSWTPALLVYTLNFHAKYPHLQTTLKNSAQYSASKTWLFLLHVNTRKTPQSKLGLYYTCLSWLSLKVLVRYAWTPQCWCPVLNEWILAPELK